MNHSINGVSAGTGGRDGSPREATVSTPDALVTAGRALFARRGYDGASVRAITTEAGANLGAVTYHFGSKRALYEEVLRTVVEPLRDRVRQVALGQGPSPSGPDGAEEDRPTPDAPGPEEDRSTPDAPGPEEDPSTPDAQGAKDHRSTPEGARQDRPAPDASGPHRPSAEGPRPPLDRIADVVRAFFHHLAANPDIPQLMLQEIAAGREPPPPVLRALPSILGTLAGLITEDQANGRIRAGDPRLLALSCIAQPLHLTLVKRWASRIADVELDEPAERDRVVEHAVSFAIAGLRSDPDAAPRQSSPERSS